MKKLFTLVVLSIFSIAIWAQSPNKLSYQAVVRDSDDNLVTDQAVGMQISILQGSASGTAVYTETHTPTANTNGLVSIEIGGGTTANDFSTIDWSTGVYFIKTEIDPDGGTSYSIETTSQLLSVPYAKYADKAGNVFSGSYSDLTDVPEDITVEGTAQFGSNGIVFSELREITGTTSSTNKYVVVALPSGYNEDNTHIISLQINYLGDRWTGFGSDNVNSSNNSVSYIINENALYIYYPDLDSYKDKSFRALIMKIE